jgi:hypothetical protein
MTQTDANDFLSEYEELMERKRRQREETLAKKNH